MIHSSHRQMETTFLLNVLRSPFSFVSACVEDCQYVIPTNENHFPTGSIISCIIHIIIKYTFTETGIMTVTHFAFYSNTVYYRINLEKTLNFKC